MHTHTRALLISLFALTLAGTVQPALGQAVPLKIGERTRQWTRMDGFVPMYWDELSGKLYLEISRFDQELLYQTSLPAGLGSNPIGLDRGQLGSTAVVTFQRVGPRVLLTQANYRFRALSTDAAERQAVADSFARSVLWGFKVEAAEDGRVLVDATDFLLRDAHGVIDRLRTANQGTYRVDANRTAFYLPRTKAFPKNSEVETTITLVTDGVPGPLVRQVAPSPASITCGSTTRSCSCPTWPRTRSGLARLTRGPAAST